MDRIIYTDRDFPWHDLFLKCLDWPFLAFVIFIIVIVVFREDLRKILNKSHITFKYGDNSIQLADLPNQLDKDIDPIKERLEIIESQLKSVLASPTNTTQNKQTAKQSSEAKPTASNVPVKTFAPSPNTKIINSFKTNRYKYRSIRGIAASTGLTEEEVRQAIASIPAIRETTNREGKVLYYTAEQVQARIRAANRRRPKFGKYIFTKKPD